MNKSKISSIFGRGLAAKVRVTLDALQNSSSATYFTATDIVGYLLTKECPSATVEDFRNATTMVSSALSAMLRGVSGKLVRTKLPMQSSCEYLAWGPSKMAIGYSHTATEFATIKPGVNSDIMEERKQQKWFMEIIDNDPQSVIRKVLPKLTDSHLTDLMIDILSIKDERMLNVRNDLVNCRRDDIKTKSNAKLALETALAQLTSEDK